VPENWVENISQSFHDKQVKMVFGSVKIAGGESFFERLQTIEFASLMGVSAATQNLGFPTMCNGANLAFRKSVFLEVKGYEGNFDIPSGDDEFLMRKISQDFPDGIRWLDSPETVVITAPQASFNSFIQQRRRWAGKWKHNSSPLSKALAFFVLMFQAVFLILLFLSLSGIVPWKMALFLFGIKLVLEYMFIFQISDFLKSAWSLLDFLLLQFLYPPYVLFIGITTQFTPYQWKGRQWKNKN